MNESKKIELEKSVIQNESNFKSQIATLLDRLASCKIFNKPKELFEKERVKKDNRKMKSFFNEHMKKNVNPISVSIAMMLISLLLYLIVLIAISLVTLVFIASLGNSYYTDNLFHIWLLILAIYVFLLIVLALKVSLRNMKNDLKISCIISQSNKILQNQLKQIAYIAPFSLAWLALIGLRM